MSVPEHTLLSVLRVVKLKGRGSEADLATPPEIAPEADGSQFVDLEASGMPVKAGAGWGH